MKLVARVFFIAAAVIGLALLITAIVSTLFLGDVAGFGWAAALGLGAVTALPLAILGLVIEAFRSRRTSMEMPSHLPDGKRD